MDSDRKIALMLWTVIGALVFGLLVGGLIFVHKDDELTRQNLALTSDNSRLITQVKQARAALNASPTPTTNSPASP
jgi:outer membrane murein-binding lipoprotein Lpp